MNRDICHKCSKPIELCDCPTGTTYDLMRRQHTIQFVRVQNMTKESARRQLESMTKVKNFIEWGGL